MILIIAADWDPTAIEIARRIRQRGGDFALLDPQRAPGAVQFAVSAGDAFHTEVRTGGRTIDLDTVTAVWSWHPDPPDLAGVVADDRARELVQAEWKSFLDGVWHATGCRWVNRVAASRRAACKPLQLRVAGEIGFSVPDTVITNDPATVFAFHDRHRGRIIQKTLASQMWEQPDGGWAVVYTRETTRADLRNPSALAVCPVIYQENLRKLYDIRVTVVGDRVLACEIHSQLSERSRQDFRRYDLANTPYLQHALPAEVEDLCRALLRRLDLTYGAIDLVLTPEHEYVFLEVNPSGQFGWVEQLTGLPIAEALTDHLVGVAA